MDGFRERFSGRFERSQERGSSDRYDRSERTERANRSAGGYGSSDGISTKVIAETVDNSNAKQLEIIGEFFDDARNDRTEIEKELLNALDHTSAAVNKNNELTRRNAELLNAMKTASVQEQAPVVAADAAAKEEIMQAVMGNTTLLNIVRQQLAEAKDESSQADETQQQGQPDLMTAIDNYFKNMEDHVHKENVKCYRNVQAAIAEQNAQAAVQSKKDNGLLKVFAIILTVLSVANIGLLAAVVFEII